MGFGKATLPTLASGPAGGDEGQVKRMGQVNYLSDDSWFRGIEIIEANFDYLSGPGAGLFKGQAGLG